MAKTNWLSKDTRNKIVAIISILKTYETTDNFPRSGAPHKISAHGFNWSQEQWVKITEPNGAELVNDLYRDILSENFHPLARSLKMNMGFQHDDDAKHTPRVMKERVHKKYLGAWIGLASLEISTP